MSFPSSNKWTPIFVSFIGNEVLQTFISPLFKRLKQAGIGYFSHDNPEDAGHLTAILLQPRFALVVLCTSYANSNRCLDELVEILKCKRYNDLVVIPIFYKDRAGVSNLASDDEFRGALRSVEESEREAKKMVWRSALAETEEISGYELKADNGHPSLYVPVILTPC